MDSSIPALSLRQPWCWAVLFAGKSIENRTWMTRYTGRLRLHAAKTWDPNGEAWLDDRGLIVPNYFVCRDRGELGAYLGEATLVDILPPWLITDPDERAWAFGPQCWRLKDIESYPEPIPGRGYPGLYYPERIERSGRP